MLTWPIVHGLRFLQAAHLADTVHPAAHVLLGVRGQIVGAGRRLHVEHVRVLFLLPVEPQPRVHLLTLVEIDDALQLAAFAIGVVLEKELTGQLTLLEREPAPSPSLQWRK